jgi:ribosomal protein S18 acetylase RimI-like enzyme
MVKSKFDIVQWGPDRLRIGPWRGDPNIAYLAPINGRTATVDTVDRCLDVVARKGYASVLTAALTIAEQQPFLDRGFVPHEWLHLLRHDLTHIPAVTPHRLRRAFSFDHPRVLDIDARAFDSFWRFDREGLADARRATPSSRFRVADDNGVVGYAITGRAATQGYLQRLAVEPDEHRKGIGSALIADSLWWAKRRGCTSVLVNTQESNASALSLYRRMGFVPEHDGLAVLECHLDGAPA